MSQRRTHGRDATTDGEHGEERGGRERGRRGTPGRIRSDGHDRGSRSRSPIDDADGRGANGAPRTAEVRLRGHRPPPRRSGRQRRHRERRTAGATAGAPTGGLEPGGAVTALAAGARATTRRRRGIAGGHRRKARLPAMCPPVRRSGESRLPWGPGRGNCCIDRAQVAHMPPLSAL